MNNKSFVTMGDITSCFLMSPSLGDLLIHALDLIGLSRFSFRKIRVQATSANFSLERYIVSLEEEGG